jgi:putative ABC transport system ATP-binding protein
VWPSPAPSSRTRPSSSRTSPPATWTAQSADEILDLITALSKEHGKTILMVTHDPRAAERADVELHLEKGALVEAGATTVAP